MDIFQKIRALNLTEEMYIVVGGSTLVALGLLDGDDDIDICVTPEIFQHFQAVGWQQKKWAGKPVLKHDVYDVGIGFGDWNLKDLLSDAVYINGIPFMSLDKLLQWKRQMGRSKDLRHIELIERYSADHTLALECQDSECPPARYY